MRQHTVGIRQLKARLSHFMNEVKAGATVVITERGKPVGRIVPVATTVESRLQQLAAANHLAWSGRKLDATPPVAPVGPVRGVTSVAELLLEDRS